MLAFRRRVLVSTVGDGLLLLPPRAAARIGLCPVLARARTCGPRATRGDRRGRLRTQPKINTRCAVANGKNWPGRRPGDCAISCGSVPPSVSLARVTVEVGCPALLDPRRRR